ncbi:GNAT family N-acetyltransferase [Kitasatospora gansuensis]
MNEWLIHDYREDDLAAVVHLIDTTAELGQESVYSLAECITALTSRQPAVVAVSRGVPIGAALAHLAGDRAWVMRIAIAPAWRGRGLASALLRELERRLLERRVRRIAYVLPEEELLGEGLAYFEKGADRPRNALEDALEDCCRATCGARWPGWRRRRT